MFEVVAPFTNSDMEGKGDPKPGVGMKTIDCRKRQVLTKKEGIAWVTNKRRKRKSFKNLLKITYQLFPRRERKKFRKQFKKKQKKKVLSSDGVLPDF